MVGAGVVVVVHGPVGSGRRTLIRALLPQGSTSVVIVAAAVGLYAGTEPIAAGWAVLGADSFGTLTTAAPSALQNWLPIWDALPPDQHLRDGAGL